MVNMRGNLEKVVLKQNKKKKKKVNINGKQNKWNTPSLLENYVFMSGFCDTVRNHRALLVHVLSSPSLYGYSNYTLMTRLSTVKKKGNMIKT